MKTVLDGPVTEEMLETAELFGVDATSFVTMGREPTPFTVLDVKTVWNKNLAARYPHWSIDALKRVNHFYLTHEAEALIMKGHNEHLLHLAELAGLIVYQED